MNKIIFFQKKWLLPIIFAALATIIISIFFCLKPIIFGCQDITYIMGKDKPDFLKGVFANNIFGNNITDRISIDTTSVNWEKTGNYTVTYSVKDSITSKKTDTEVSINIIDGKPSIYGLKNYRFVIGNDIPDFLENVTGKNIYGDDISDLITVNTDNVNFYKAGDYLISYTLTDEITEKTISYQVVVTVVTRTPFFTGLTNRTYIIGQLYDYLSNVKAFDYNGNEIDLPIILDISNIKEDKPGTYIIRYTVTDREENSFSEQVEITLKYKSPVINVKEETLIININDFGQLELDAKDNIESAFDEFNKTITDKVEIDYTKIKIDVKGEYPLKYSVSAEDGAIITKTINVIILENEIPDSTPPVLSGIQDYIEYILPDNIPNNDPPYSLLLNGVIAEDEVDGIITDRIIIDFPEGIKFNRPGEYTITYNVSDLSENNAPSVSIQLKILDYTSPNIYNFPDNFIYIISEPVPDYLKSIMANDNVDGDLTSKILCDDKEVEYGIIGEYRVKFSVTDSSLNEMIIYVDVIVKDSLY